MGSNVKECSNAYYNNSLTTHTSNPSWACTKPTHTNNDTALLDSGANVSLVKQTARVAPTTQKHANKRIVVPNGNTMHTSDTATFHWNNISEKGKLCYKVQGIVHNLAAVANLVDEGHEVTFREHDAIVTQNNNKNVVLRGWRDTENRLWRVPITSPTPFTTTNNATSTCQVNSIYDCQGEKQLIQFYHATLFSPVKTTLLKAIKKGYLRGWPGLTAQAVQRNINVEEATVKGHLNQKRQGIRSTKKNQPTEKRRYHGKCPTRTNK